MSTDDTSGKDVVAANQNGDVEGKQEKLKFPYSIFFIVSNEFCERFNYYGMRTILALYLTRELIFNDDDATIIYHSFTTLVYFVCIIGAVIADSWWGKFNTILWLSMVYVTGSVILTLGAVKPWNMPAMVFTFLGLALIAIGSGGIKPCVAAFGGEQFKMPEQAKLLGYFFSMFYFSINLGSFISTLVTPILREQTCFGMASCFPLGFGLPAALMAISIVIFLAGKFMYKILPNQGNMLLKVCKCISNAISTKRKEKTTNPQEHWLDYAGAKYGKKLVNETKILLNVLVLYIPLPLFWALFDQQGSRWTFQATRMNGDVGWFTIRPDQMQVINPLLILAFIPLYEVLFYPLLNLIGIRRPLQKITLGGIFAGVAFLCSMGVEIIIEPTYPVLPIAGQSQFRMFNGKNCAYQMSTSLPGDAARFELPINGYYESINVPVNGDSMNFSLAFTTSSPGCQSYNTEGVLHSGKANSFFVAGSLATPAITPFEDNPDKSRQGRPTVRLLANMLTARNVTIQNKDNKHEIQSSNRNQTDDIPAGVYDIIINNSTIKSAVPLKLGGVYTIIVNEVSTNSFTVADSFITAPNSVNMLWLVPQYVIMTLGEVMYSVTGLAFSYTQAPESMKSVLQGCWLLTVAVGNLIVTIIVGAKIFNSQTYEFLLFAVLMFLDMGAFTWLAIRYKPISLEILKQYEEEEKQNLTEKKKDPLDHPGTADE